MCALLRSVFAFCFVLSNNRIAVMTFFNSWREKSRTLSTIFVKSRPANHFSRHCPTLLTLIYLVMIFISYFSPRKRQFGWKVVQRRPKPHKPPRLGCNFPPFLVIRLLRNFREQFANLVSVNWQLWRNVLPLGLIYLLPLSPRIGQAKRCKRYFCQHQLLFYICDVVFTNWVKNSLLVANLM